MLKIRRQRVEMESESWVLAESEDELKEKERTNGGRTVSQRRERERWWWRWSSYLLHANADTAISFFETPINASFWHPTRHTEVLSFLLLLAALLSILPRPKRSLFLFFYIVTPLLFQFFQTHSLSLTLTHTEMATNREALNQQLQQIVNSLKEQVLFLSLLIVCLVTGFGLCVEFEFVDLDALICSVLWCLLGWWENWGKLCWFLVFEKWNWNFLFYLSS